MKTTIKIGATTYTLVDSEARISDVKAQHEKCKGKHRKHVMLRANASARIYPTNGANVSVKEYCEQYYRTNQYVFGGSKSFSRETLDFFEPLSARRCYAQGEYSEEVTA